MAAGESLPISLLRGGPGQKGPLAVKIHVSGLRGVRNAQPPWVHPAFSLRTAIHWHPASCVCTSLQQARHPTDPSCSSLLHLTLSFSPCSLIRHRPDRLISSKDFQRSMHGTPSRSISMSLRTRALFCQHILRTTTAPQHHSSRPLNSEKIVSKFQSPPHRHCATACCALLLCFCCCTPFICMSHLHLSFSSSFRHLISNPTKIYPNDTPQHGHRLLGHHGRPRLLRLRRTSCSAQDT